MQAACLQENAAQAMNLLGRSIYSRGNDNMSRHVLIAVENGVMKFTASSGQTYITATIGSMIDQPGRVTQPGRLFHDYVNSLPAERLDFAADPDNPLTLKVNCGQREWSRILGAAPQHFPATPQVSADHQFEIDPEVFQDARRRTLFSAAKEDTRPVLNTVCLDFSPEGLRAASADGFRLSAVSRPLEKAPQQEFQLLVPAKDLEEAARLAQYQTNPLVIVADADLKWVEVRTQAATLVTQLFNGQFPNYDGLIPTEWTTRATFSRSTATLALRDNSILRSNMEGADSILRVRAQSTETGDAGGEMNAEIEGADNRIAFNAKYVQEILNRVGADQLRNTNLFRRRPQSGSPFQTIPSPHPRDRHIRTLDNTPSCYSYPRNLKMAKLWRTNWPPIRRCLRTNRRPTPIHERLLDTKNVQVIPRTCSAT